MAAAGAGGTPKKLFVWGENGYGGLGLGNTTDISSPVQLGSDGDWQRASVGLFSLFIKPDGTLWSCGYGAYGATGHGSTANTSSPIQIGSETTWSFINTITTGVGGVKRPRSAAIKTDGTLWMWGNNNGGALGDGGNVSKSSPVQIGALTNWKKVVMGRQFTLALKTDGTIWSWGVNDSFQLGTGETNQALEVSSPVQIGSLTTWIDIGAGGNAAGAVRSDGKMYTWGTNYYGNLGNTLSTSRPAQSSPVLVLGSESFTSIASAYSQWVCVQADGSMFSWGRNYRGQLGIGLGPGVGFGSRVQSPVQIGGLTDWAGWGVNIDGEDVLAFGSNNNSAVPATGVSWAKTKTDGTLWAWGNGGSGAIGKGNTTSYSSPVQIGTSTKWLSAYTGFGAAWAFEEA